MSEAKSKDIGLLPEVGDDASEEPVTKRTKLAQYQTSNAEVGKEELNSGALTEAKDSQLQNAITEFPHSSYVRGNEKEMVNVQTVHRNVLKMDDFEDVLDIDSDSYVDLLNTSSLPDVSSANAMSSLCQHATVSVSCISGTQQVLSGDEILKTIVDMELNETVLTNDNQLSGLESSGDGPLEITDYSPEWSFAEGETKVLVIGPWNQRSSSYSLMFDDLSVQASLVQDGVLRCYAPAHAPGDVCLCVACDGLLVSMPRSFKYISCNEAKGCGESNKSIVKGNGSERKMRWDDEKYGNYIKIIDALFCIRDGLGVLCLKIMSSFQCDMMQRHNIPQLECGKPSCSARNIKNGQLNPSCSNNICTSILHDIMQEHKSKRNPNGIYWENCQIHKWAVECWEIGKAFMGRGQRASNIGPDDCDSAAILQLISNCRIFRQFVSCEEVDKLLHLRNTLMHSSRLESSHTDTENAFCMLTDFVKLVAQSLPETEDFSSVKETLTKTAENLTEMKEVGIEDYLANNEKSSHNKETLMIKEKIQLHTDNLNIADSTQKVEELKMVIPLLKMITEDNDLMVEVEDGFDNLVSLLDVEELNVAGKATLSVVPDQMVYLRNDVVYLSSELHRLQRVPGINYKGQLVEVLHRKQVNSLPKYNQWMDIASNNKWWASVNFLLDSELKTFISPVSHMRIVAAQHSAAAEALKFFRSNEELL